MNVNVIGLDIAKTIFHLFSLNAEGKPVKKKLKRPDTGLYRPASREFNRHGSLWGRPLLGQGV